MRARARAAPRSAPRRPYPLSPPPPPPPASPFSAVGGDIYLGHGCYPLGELAATPSGGAINVTVKLSGACNMPVHTVLGEVRPVPGFRATAQLIVTRTARDAVVYAREQPASSTSAPQGGEPAPIAR